MDFSMKHKAWVLEDLDCNIRMQGKAQNQQPNIKREEVGKLSKALFDNKEKMVN
jgi:hypothetical protein